MTASERWSTFLKSGFLMTFLILITDTEFASFCLKFQKYGKKVLRGDLQPYASTNSSQRQGKIPIPNS